MRRIFYLKFISKTVCFRNCRFSTPLELTIHNHCPLEYLSINVPHRKRTDFIFFGGYLLISLLLFSCGGNKKDNASEKIQYELTGNAQGTTFMVKYLTDDSLDVSEDVKIIFDQMDHQLSTYIDSSVISLFNNSRDTFRILLPADTFFRTVFYKSKEIYEKSEGAFNPAVMPLVKYWGFSREEMIPDKIDSLKVDSLLHYTDFSSCSFKIIRPLGIRIQENMLLDFNGIAQGYTVDLICEMLEKKNIHDYMVEIGGEVRAKGRNKEGKPWNIGIDKPVENNDDHQLQAIIPLEDRALATSGNYRKFYVKDGVKFSHTIDPKTGFPVQHNLLSASVLAPDCAMADAYATVFMVYGVEKTKTFLKDNPELKLDVYLIYSDVSGDFKTWASEGISKLVDEDLE